MSERKVKSRLRSALDSMINEARVICANPNSQPAVTQQLMTRPFLKRIARTRGLRMYLLAAGIADEIRRYLKRTPEDDGITPDQLDLWAANLRPIIQDIDRARVFVPSIGEYVLLDPAHINSAQTKEAGAYLIAKGQDCIRVGTQLLSLAQEMESSA